jgi:hypothetical protein
MLIWFIGGAYGEETAFVVVPLEPTGVGAGGTGVVTDMAVGTILVDKESGDPMVRKDALAASSVVGVVGGTVTGSVGCLVKMSS